MHTHCTLYTLLSTRYIMRYSIIYFFYFYLANSDHYKTSNPRLKHQVDQSTKWSSTPVRNCQTTHCRWLLASFLFNTCWLQPPLFNSTSLHTRVVSVNCLRAHQQIGAPRIMPRFFGKTCCMKFLELLSCDILQFRLSRICYIVFRLSRYYWVFSLAV